MGQLSRARRWDYAGSTIPASEPVYPDVPASAPTWDLRFAYSQGHRVLKSAAQDGGEALHTAEVFGTLRLAQTEYVASIEDYKNEPVHQSVYLGGVGRLVYDPSLPAPGATPDSRHVFFQAGDHLGSTAVVFDNQTGEVVERTTFQALGGVESDYRPARWGSFREDYKFTGKEEDVEVGLVYFGARYYHPKLGRFASADPLTIHAAGADLNPYAYVGGRVTSSVDPLGLSPDDQPKKDFTPGPCGTNCWVDEQGITNVVVAPFIDPRANDATSIAVELDAVVAALQAELEGLAPNFRVLSEGLRDIDIGVAAAKDPNVGDAIDGARLGALHGLADMAPLGLGDTVGPSAAPRGPSGVFAHNRARAGIEAATAAAGGVLGALGAARPPPGGVPPEPPGIVNRGGRFGDLDKMKRPREVGHHMPQNAFNEHELGRKRLDGPALGMTKEDHERTRTFSGRGKMTMREDAGLNARDRMARDVRDVRRLFGPKYNRGIREMLEYAKTLPEYARRGGR